MAQDEHDDFNAAVTSMTEGDLDRARRLFVQLSFDEEHERWAASMAYLGEAQWLLGDRDSARSTFQRLLAHSPDYQMSPYHHGEEIRAQFALLRQRRILEAPVDVQPVRFRWMTLAPFGVAQSMQRRPGAAWRIGVLQTGLALGSLSTFYALERINRPPGRRQNDWTREQTIRRVRTLRYGAQLPLTAAFYISWGLSARDAHRHRTQWPVRDTRPVR